ncbi:beta strand repeat-containing protein [Arthrobacter liuii]|uniref:Bacterial Ig-like domain-containing protein n=1 Tax=Arthrobacter liuii TaxID=1476996 RepID=A0ABQ2AGD0_9MICC|nr:Ig-like domain-containing protein [Arthrobacter liuii]GGH91240.1 hypothetical protein GCM10007170_06930 [Arthrobacter liuii]
MSLMFLRPSRRLPWIVTALLLLLGTGTAAYAFWAATTSSSNAAAAADTLSPGSRPAVTAANSGMTVSWAGGTTVNGRSATGYTVTRYSAATGGTGTAATGGCAGTVTTLACTEQAVPGGIWYYTVTPAIALWTGTESPRSSGTSNDASAPVATVSGISPAPNTAGWNNTSPVTVTITADDGTSGSGVASISYTVDGGGQQTVNAAVATVPVSGDGTHTVSYFATDKVGNAGSPQSQTVRIDTQAPAAPAFTTVPTYVTLATVSGVAISGTAEAGTTVSLVASDSAGHSVPATASASGTGAWSATFNLSSLNEGTVTFSATATDAASNVGAAKTATSTKDTVAPAAASAWSVPTYVNSATAASIRISGNAEAGATVAVSAMSPGSATAVTGTAAANGGSWSLNLDLRSLKDGTVTYTATVTDAAGNTSSAATASDTKDTTAPILSITAPMYASGSSKVTGTTEAGTVVSVTVRDSALNTVTTQVNPTGTSWSTTMDISSLRDGALTYTASAADAAGNTGTVTAGGTTTKDTTLPSVVDVTGQNGVGSTSNSLDKGDFVTIEFSEAMDPAKFCAGWSGAELSGTATIADGGNNDTISFTAGTCVVPAGNLYLGANYVGTTPAVFAANGNGNGGTPSILTLDATGKILTIKLGTYRSNSGNLSTPVTQGIPSYRTAAGPADMAGNALPAGVTTSGKTKTNF